jgi:hypothetical protein
MEDSDALRAHIAGRSGGRNRSWFHSWLCSFPS